MTKITVNFKCCEVHSEVLTGDKAGIDRDDPNYVSIRFSGNLAAVFSHSEVLSIIIEHDK